jgi:hypothetical protein
MAETSNQLAPDVILHRGLTKFESSDTFKKMSPREKIASYQAIYKKYAVPALKAKGLNTSMFDWIKERSGQVPTIAEQASKKEVAAAGIAHGFTSMLKAGNDFYEKHFMFPEEVNKRGRIRQAIKDVIDREAKVTAQYHNPKSIKSELLFTAGTAGGQVPAFALTDGIMGKFGLTELLEGEALAKAGPAEKFFAKSIKDAAEGYLVGAATGDNPKQSAVAFAVMNPLGRAGFKFISKLTGLGGTKLVSETVEKAVNRAEVAAPETTASSAVVSTVGTPKQKLTAAMVRTLQSALPKGKMWNAASPEERQFAIEVLAKQEPEIAKSLLQQNEELVALKAEQDLTAQRKASPGLNGLLSKIESLDKTPSSVSIAKHAGEEATTANVKASPNIAYFRNNGTVVPGAASISSLEFESNMSRRVDEALSQMGIGKDKIAWEDRGHKLLFFLNVLEAEHAMKGPSKEREMLTQMLMRHLGDRYPQASPEMMVGMSDQVWNKLEALTKAGMFDATEGPVRVWRQTHLGEGTSPFAHEVKLFRQAGMAGSEFEIGQRVRVGATHDFGRVIESDKKTSIVQLTSGKKISVGNWMLSDGNKSIVEAQEKIIQHKEAQAVEKGLAKDLEKQQAKSLSENIKLGREKARARERLIKEEGLARHGAGAASAEELSRNEVFVKIRGDGTLAFQGVSPDPATRKGLKADEVIVAVNKRTGEIRWQDGNQNTMQRYSQTVKDVVQVLKGKKK